MNVVKSKVIVFQRKIGRGSGNSAPYRVCQLQKGVIMFMEVKRGLRRSILLTLLMDGSETWTQNVL